jgi:hypothetical protein
MMMAWFTPMERVPTGSAIAFAASVDPFTNIDPKMRTITIARKGLDATVCRNWGNVTMVLLPFSQQVRKRYP